VNLSLEQFAPAFPLLEKGPENHCDDDQENGVFDENGIGGEKIALRRQVQKDFQYGKAAKQINQDAHRLFSLDFPDPDFQIIQFFPDHVVPLFLDPVEKVVHLHFQVLQQAMVLLALNTEEQHDSQPQEEKVPQMPENIIGQYAAINGVAEKSEYDKDQTPEEHRLNIKINTQEKSCQIQIKSV
jgi:hypothetical protein